MLAALAAQLASAAVADASLARRAYLVEELAAARSQQFYLLLDTGAPALDLKIDSVRVHRFALDKAEFGQSRLAGSAHGRWPNVAFSLVSEVPEPDRPRIEVQKADDADKQQDMSIKQALAKGKQATGELSQTAGEKVARLYQADDPTAPLTYRLLLEPDLVLVVRGEPKAIDFGSRLRRLNFALQEGWRGFGLWLAGKSVSTRVVVYMSPEDARRLFKVLTPQIKLLVYVPPPG